MHWLAAAPTTQICLSGCVTSRRCGACHHPAGAHGDDVRLAGQDPADRAAYLFIGFWAFAGAFNFGVIAVAFGLPMLAAAAWWTKQVCSGSGQEQVDLPDSKLLVCALLNTWYSDVDPPLP